MCHPVSWLKSACPFTYLLDVEGRDGLHGLGSTRAHADGRVALKVGQVAARVEHGVGEALVVERVLHLLHPGRSQEHHERHELCNMCTSS